MQPTAVPRLMGCETGRSSLPSLTIARAEGAGKRRRAVIGGQIFFAVIASGLLTYCCPLVAKGAARRLGAFRRERSRAEPGAGGRRAAALAKIHGSWRPHEFPSSEFAEVDAPRQGRCRSILDRMRESGQRQGLGAASRFCRTKTSCRDNCRRCRWRPATAARVPGDGRFTVPAGAPRP